MGPNIRISEYPPRRKAREQTTSDGQQMIAQSFQQSAKMKSETLILTSPLIWEFKSEMLNERFLWNALKQAEKKNTARRKEFYDHGTQKRHNGVS